MDPEKEPAQETETETPEIDPNAPPGKGFLTEIKEVFEANLKNVIGEYATPVVPAPAPKAPAKPDPYDKILSGEAPAAAPTEVDEQDPANLSEANKPHWDKVKKARKEAEARAAAAEARAKELEQKYNPTEVEALRKSEREKDELLATVALERHPEFQKRYDSKRAGLVELAKKAGGEHGDKLASILDLPDSPFRTEQLNALMPELSPVSQARIGGILNNLDILQNGRNAELSKARESLKQLEEREKAGSEQRNQARSAQSQRTIEEEINRWSDPTEGVPAMQERAGDESWNNQIKEARDTAKKIFNGSVSDIKEMARHSLKAAAFPQVLRHAKALADENEQLKLTVEQLTNAQPGRPVNRGAADAGDGQTSGSFISDIVRVARQGGMR